MEVYKRTMETSHKQLAQKQRRHLLHNRVHESAQRRRGKNPFWSVSISNCPRCPCIKSIWPELVGATGEQALHDIQMEEPSLRLVEIVHDDDDIPLDYQWERVQIFVDSNGRVAWPPQIG